MTKGRQLGSRDKVLGSIRRAIVVPAPHPGAHHGAEETSAQFQSTLPMVGANAPRAWLPLVGEKFEDWVQLFSANSQDLRTEFIVCDNQDVLAEHLKRLAQANNWQQIGTHRGDLNDFAAQTLGLPQILTDDAYDIHQLEKCEAGISQCDALVAQTGSVLITNQSAGGRVLSVLPPHHVVLAYKEQLLPDLPAAFALLEEKYGSNYPSLMGFITGPSRTGDIERILVLGAHGPKKLTVLLV